MQEEPEPIASGQPEGAGAPALDRRAMPRQGAEGSLCLDRGSRSRVEKGSRSYVGGVFLRGVDPGRPDVGSPPLGDVVAAAALLALSAGLFTLGRRTAENRSLLSIA